MRAVPGSFAGRLALIVAAGAVLRVLYTVLVAPWPPEFSDDQVFYNLQAHLLADGRGFIQPQLALAGVVRQSAAHPPLYPLVLAGLDQLGGGDQLVQRLTGTLFGSGTVIVIALLARRLAGARAALIAAALAAVYPLLVTTDGALMSESLNGLLIGLAVIAAYRMTDTRSLRWAAVVGALVGLAALTRGEALALLPLLFVPLLRGGAWLRPAATATLAMVLVLTPWTIHNYDRFDRFVLVSTNGGAVIGGANCADTYAGSNIGGWSLFCARPWPGHNEAEETARQFGDGVRYARDHERRLPIVAAARFGRAFSLVRPFQTNTGRDPATQDAGVIMYYLLVPLAAYGLVVLRRRGAAVWLALTPFVMVAITAVIFYGFLRFRQPAEITIVVLAAVALERLVGRRRPAAQRA